MIPIVPTKGSVGMTRMWMDHGLPGTHSSVRSLYFFNVQLELLMFGIVIVAIVMDEKTYMSYFRHWALYQYWA
jgi:hypothetical protein